MKLMLRAVNEYDESVCKPVSVIGEILNSGAFGDRFVPKNRVVMRALDSGFIHRICFVDPKTGQELPSVFSWPGSQPYAVGRGMSVSLARSRLTVRWPPKEEEPKEAQPEHWVVPTIEETAMSVAAADEQLLAALGVVEEAEAVEPETLAQEVAPVDATENLYATTDGRIVNEDQLRAEGMVVNAIAAPANIDRAFFETMRAVGLPAYVMNDDGEVVPAPR